MAREWRPVVGYEGIYEVSNDGKVKSLERVIVYPDGHSALWREKEKKLTENNDGYLTVKLSKDGNDERRNVHRLVYEAFVGAIPEGYEINHIDFNRKNNSVDNLEILTHTENIQYTIDAGRHVSSTADVRGSNNPNYGNRKLSAKYAENPDLSKEKQGRPGMKNGRCRPVRLTYADGSTECFDYITECANALIDRGVTKQHASDGVVSSIITAISKHRPYRKIAFEYI